jgi:hypothetical protein
MESKSFDQVISTLKQYNSWRRGDDSPQPDPKEIGEALDAAIELLSKQQKRRPLTFRWNHTTKPSLFEAWENGVLIYSGPYYQAPSIKPHHIHNTDEPE